MVRSLGIQSLTACSATLVAVLVSCGAPRPTGHDVPPGAALSRPKTPPSPSAFPVLRDHVVSEMLVIEPALGRQQLSRHEYDGKLADYSEAGFAHRVDSLHQWKAALETIDAAGLDSNDWLDLALLRFAVENELFALVDLDAEHKRPDAYADIFDVAQYLDDEDVPLALRLERIVVHEEKAAREAPRVLENLKPPLSRAVARWQAGFYEGVASFLRDDVPKRLVGAGNDALRDRFARANEALASHAARIGKALRTWSAQGDESHRLGPARYARFLLATEGIAMPLADFQRMGEDNLAADEAAFETLAKSTTLARPTQSEELAVAAQMTDEARGFVLAHHIVSIPPGEHPVPVRAAPAYFRSSGAQLVGAGTSAVYYITPPDSSLSPADQRDFVMPYGVLRTNTVHEVYPGHYVQALWADHAPTTVQKLSFSMSFTEGWAHYSEQMMLEEGFGIDRAEDRLGQLREALRRDCRYLASIGIHTEGMTLEQAENLFVTRCHQDRGTAQQNALRGEYDPGYFSYTLGKLEILGLRDEAKRRLGDHFSLQRFHDALLAHGRPPIPLLRPVVLHELAQGEHLP